jgi:lipoprotein-releasing system ATP-binding protein
VAEGRRGDRQCASDRPAMPEPFLVVRDLTRGFVKDSEAIEVLRGIGLDVGRGDTLAITGASGVGKSTLMHILGTLDRPSSGTVRYNGEDVFRLDDRGLARFRNRTIGFVFQFHHLMPELSALENVMMPALIQRMRRRPAVAMAQGILGELGLSGRLRHKPGELSGGEQQRVAIARALVLGPQIILADEPTGNLDRRTGEGVEDLLLDMNRQLKATLVVVTHNPSLSRKMGRRLEMVDGRIVDQEPGAKREGEGR